MPTVSWSCLLSQEFPSQRKGAAATTGSQPRAGQLLQCPCAQSSCVPRPPIPAASRCPLPDPGNALCPAANLPLILPDAAAKRLHQEPLPRAALRHTPSRQPGQCSLKTPDAVGEPPLTPESFQPRLHFASVGMGPADMQSERMAK